MLRLLRVVQRQDRSYLEKQCYLEKPSQILGHGIDILGLAIKLVSSALLFLVSGGWGP